MNASSHGRGAAGRGAGRQAVRRARRYCGRPRRSRQRCGGRGPCGPTGCGGTTDATRATAGIGSSASKLKARLQPVGRERERLRDPPRNGQPGRGRSPASASGSLGHDIPGPIEDRAMDRVGWHVHGRADDGGPRNANRPSRIRPANGDHRVAAPLDRAVALGHEQLVTIDHERCDPAADGRVDRRGSRRLQRRTTTSAPVRWPSPRDRHRPVGAQQERRQVGRDVRERQDVGMQLDPERLGHERAGAPRSAPRPPGRRPRTRRAADSSASAMPSSMFVVKYGVPVAGMMSTWNAIPDRSSIVEPGADRRVHPLVEVDLVARVEEDAEERVAEVAVDDRLEGAAGLADVQRLVPLGDRREVRRRPAARRSRRSPSGSSGGVLDDEPGAAVERAPDPEGHRERVAALDRRGRPG